MAQLITTVRMVAGLALFGIAAFFWSVEVQSVVVPYHPFSRAATGVYVGITLAAGLLGTWVARTPGRVASWSERVDICLRYFLAFQMLKYGMAKIIPVQFSPALYWNDIPLPQLGAFERAWIFFSHSRAYELFLGGFEVGAGLLLVARRTALAGALATFAIMLNITIIDVEFDVPIVWDASVFTTMTLHLMATRHERLLALFWKHDGTPPARGRGIVAAAMALTFLGYHGVGLYRTRYGGDWFSPVYGTWAVVEASDASGRPVEPGVLGFDRVYFEEGSYLHVRTLDGRVTERWTSYDVEGDRLRTKHPALQFDGDFQITGDRLRLRGTESVRRLSTLVLERVPGPLPSKSP